MQETLKKRVEDMAILLYKFIVRPQIKYTSQLYSHFLKKRKKIATLEKIQLEAIELIQAFPNKPYEKKTASLKFALPCLAFP